MAATSSPLRTSVPNDASSRALLADCAATREEVRAVREKMRETVCSAQAGLRTATEELAAIKAYVRKLLER